MEMNRRFENDDVVVRCWLNSTLVMLFTGSCTQRFWNEMWHQQNGPISAAPVEEALCQLHPQIFKLCGKYHQQQDAAEAWTLLTNNLQKAFLQSNNPERAARLEQMYAYTLAPAVGCLQLDCDAMEVEEDKEQKMVMLHVPTLLPDGRLVHRLMDGIEAELREHSHNPFCHYIEGKMISWKGKAMRELPPMLIVQLKRFDFKGMSSKLHHAGSQSCVGEYQTPDGAWQHISDADMSHSSLQSALSHQTEVYMAVYKRLSSRSPVQQAQPCRSSAGETVEERAINERKAARNKARQGSLLKGSTAASPRRQPNRKGKQLLQPKKLLIAAAAVMLGRMLQQHYKRK
ncbi:hypothetical protein WJX82_005957 [Trebouxia sp. C0006]